jgi:hypothetical protein
MTQPQLITCEANCYCYYCNINIPKGEKYLEMRKNAWRGVARINICARCLKLINPQINNQDVKAIENRLALKELTK